MSQLTVPYDEGEKLLIGNELSKVFSLQDIPLGKEKKGYFLEEIYLCGLPVGAILEGLRSLSKDDVSSIKINTIIDAARRHLQPNEAASAACTNCSDGIVLMRDEKGYRFSIGCNCERGGQRARSLRLAIWTGEAVQVHNGRTLFPIPRVPVAGE